MKLIYIKLKKQPQKNYFKLKIVTDCINRKKNFLGAGEV